MFFVFFSLFLLNLAFRIIMKVIFNYCGTINYLLSILYPIKPGIIVINNNGIVGIILFITLFHNTLVKNIVLILDHFC